MTCANDSFVETLPKEFLSLCAQAFEQEVEIMHSNVRSNKDLNSSYKSHIEQKSVTFRKKKYKYKVTCFF